MSKSIMLCALLLLGSAFIHHVLEPRRDRSKPSFTRAIESSVSVSPGGIQRVWRDVKFQRDTSFDERLPVLYGPLRIRQAIDRDDLLIIDFGVMKVHRIGVVGGSVVTFGEGQGQGPGEFGMITDVAMSRKGVFVADHANGKIVEFGLNGELEATSKLSIPPYRLAVDASGHKTLLRIEGSELLFGTLGHGTGKVENYGRILRDQVRHGIALDGWVESHPEGGVIFAGLYIPIVVSYDTKGEMRFARNMVNSWAPPDVERDSKGASWVSPSARIAAVSLSVKGSEFFVTSVVEDGLDRTGVVDSYSIDSGDYLWSLKIPEKCQSAVVLDESVYTVKEAAVSRWLLGPDGR